MAQPRYTYVHMTCLLSWNFVGRWMCGWAIFVVIRFSCSTANPKLNEILKHIWLSQSLYCVHHLFVTSRTHAAAAAAWQFDRVGWYTMIAPPGRTIRSFASFTQYTYVARAPFAGSATSEYWYRMWQQQIITTGRRTTSGADGHLLTA